MTSKTRYQPSPEERALLEEASQPVLEAIRVDRDRSEGHVRKMLEYILDLDRLTQQGLTAGKWSSACGISNKVELIDFHRAMGDPPRRYLTRHRIDLAKELLERSEIPTSKIAILLGFASAATFGNAFKREVGPPPNRFRLRRQLQAELTREKG